MYRCFVILCLFVGTKAFFFDTESPIIYESGQNSDYFGYSVALFGGQEPWIQIGAPKGVSNNLQSGVVYRCGILQRCYGLDIEDTTNLNGSFIGNAMDVNIEKNIYAVCGHRWTKRKTDVDYYAHGTCFYGSTKTNETKMNNIIGDKDANTIQYNSKEIIYNYGQAQAGMAARFKNDGSGDLVVGAPGTYNWAGLVLLLKENSNLAPPAARRSKRDLNGLLLPEGKSAQEGFFSYFGYSVSSGKYRYQNETLIAAGVPRSNMIGKVVLFQFHNNEIEKIVQFEGSQFGEYFGGAIATADVNGDGKDDLIVGAPTYKKGKYDEGRVYIYYTDTQKSEGKTQTFITGDSTGGRFGETVAALGDIDQDGYEDIAVAAPNEDDGRGVVYIYRGSEAGLRTTPIQKIMGKSFGESFRGFGYSMSRGTDIDGNNCKDLAIGAYQSGHVFLFRSRPVISLTNTLRTSVNQIPTDRRNFSFESCIQHHKNCRNCSLSPTMVEVKIVIDPTLKRASIEQPDRVVTLNPNGDQSCENYNVNLASDSSHPEQPLRISVTAELMRPPGTTHQERLISPIFVSNDTINGTDNFCKDCPVLDAGSKKEFDYSIDFFLGCGSDNKCRSRLIVTPSFVNIENNQFIIGSQKNLIIQTAIKNEGDKAYSTKLSVNFPGDLSLRSVPSSCQENNKTSITCTVDNPLDEGVTKHVNLDFDMDNVNNGDASLLDFELKIDTSSENMNLETTKMLTLQAIKVADITLTGKSKENLYNYENASSVVEFGQVLQVQKEGQSPIDDIAVDIAIPTSLKANSMKFLELSLDRKCREISTSSSNNHLSRKRRSADPETYLQYTNRTLYINCTDQSPFHCSRYMCNTGKLSSLVYEIQLKFKLNVSLLQDVLDTKDIIVFSTHSISSIVDSDIRDVSSDRTRYTAIVSSVLLGYPIEEPISIWIIIAAVVGGIVLLTVIIGLLYKFGFFERKTKKLLEEAQNQENAPLNEVNED